MELCGGIDLHSNNSYLGIVNEENRAIYKERHRNELPLILSALAPNKSGLKAVAVESTFNWYWLVDGLLDAGYPVHLANPAAMKEYKGLKQKDDKKSALWLATLLRGINLTMLLCSDERTLCDITPLRISAAPERWHSTGCSSGNIPPLSIMNGSLLVDRSLGGQRFNYFSSSPPRRRS